MICLTFCHGLKGWRYFQSNPKRFLFFSSVGHLSVGVPEFYISISVDAASFDEFAFIAHQILDREVLVCKDL